MRGRVVSGLVVLTLLPLLAPDLPRTLKMQRERIASTHHGLGPVGTPSGDVGDASTTKLKVLEAYAALPLQFEVNKGQTDPSVRFLSRGRDSTVFLASTEAVLVLHQPSGAPQRRRPNISRGPHRILSQQPSTAVTTAMARTVLRMRFVGSNDHPRVIGRKLLPTKSHYFLGSNPRQWHTDVHSYAEVMYQSIYPGIDVVFYGSQGRLEYDFVVSPRADPARITLAFRGAGNAIDRRGDLVLKTVAGEIRQPRPRVYQRINGATRMIPAGYVARGRDRVGFAISAYDSTQPLIIDPVLVYSTYLGGSGDEGALAVKFDVAVDQTGSAYVTGETASLDFPHVNAVQARYEGGLSEVFVTKLTPTGSVLVYSTYLGGRERDQGRGIAVDQAGGAYVTGLTASRNFPVTPGAFDTSCGTDGLCNSVTRGMIRSDAFVTKLSADGSSFVYSTYLGGSDFEVALGIAVDQSASAYVSGITGSTDFPTASPLQVSHGGGLDDAFVTKLNPTGTALVYSTYLGGNGLDQAFDVALDGSANAYVVGLTGSTNLPTVNAFQGALAGVLDAFVAKLNTSGDALVYSTFLGGSGGDGGLGIIVDLAGSAYVTGQTTSSNFPTTPGSLDTLCGTDGLCNGGADDAFVTKFSPAGTALVYSTYLGGMHAEGGRGITVDQRGSAHVTGFTDSGFPTVNAIQGTFGGGGSDAFVAKLNQSGSILLYSTYLGGSLTDRGFGIAVDQARNAYVVGQTNSADFPTMSAVQPNNAGGFDAFISKIAP